MKILILQAVAFWFMTGVTWVLQMLNYPLIAKVPNDKLPAYQVAHNKLFGRLMIPGVVLSFITTLILVFQTDEIAWFIPACQLGILLLIVTSARVHAARAHEIFESGFDPDSFRLLILSNWGRLAGWLLLSVASAFLLNS